MWLYLACGYLLAGAALAASSRGRKLIWEAGRDLRPSANPLAPRRSYPVWKVAAFYVLVTGAAVVLWPLFVKEIAKRARESRPENIREFGRRSRAAEVPKGWLRNRITVAEAEAKHMVDLGLGGEGNEQTRRARLEFARSRGVPVTGGPIRFGFMNREWAELVASVQDGDELWEYCSSEHSWEHLAGRAGIALVRRGEVVDTITTAMN